MSRTDSRSPPRPIATFRKTRSVAIQWVVVSAVSFFGFAYAFGHVLAALRGTSLEPIVITVLGPTDAVVWLAVSVGVVALVVIPHELLHGVFMARYGDSPSYGIGLSYFVLPYAYAETSGAIYTRNQLLVALLAPFAVITAVGLAAMVVFPTPLLIVPLAANAAGSIGDLWMAGVLCQYPADVRVGDPPGGVRGFGIYGAEEGSPSRLPGTTLLSRFLAGSVGTLAAVVAYALVAVFLSLAFGSGDVVLGDPDGGWLLFRHDRRPGGTAFLEIGDRALLGVAALGGLVWTFVATLWRRLE